MPPPTFDEIPELLRELVRPVASDLRDLDPLFAIRDLRGRVRFLLGTRPASGTPAEKALERLARESAERLGPHAHEPSQALLYQDELEIDPGEQAITEVLWEGPPRLYLVDRQVTGQAWSTVTETTPVGPSEARRFAFYSLKGGVGRSTATAVAAWHLARQGRNVLVLDLDLDAPGLSTSLLPVERKPDYGIVDWFVEDAVGQGDFILDRMVASSPLASELPGSLLVVPSHGSNPGEYIAKLGRCYLDLTHPAGVEPWVLRMRRLVDALEVANRPDVVLLDTRAGLSDLSAAGVTDLGADLFLFAIGTEQTWEAYELLFSHWRRLGVISKLRDRLQVVASMVPETERPQYLDMFVQDSWNLFLEQVYDEAASGELDAFSFDLDDRAAPHQPVPIYWHRGIGALRNFESLDEHLVHAAFGPFLDRLDQLLSADEEVP